MQLKCKKSAYDWYSLHVFQYAVQSSAKELLLRIVCGGTRKLVPIFRCLNRWLRGFLACLDNQTIFAKVCAFAPSEKIDLSSESISALDASPNKQLNTSSKASYCHTFILFASDMAKMVSSLDQMQTKAHWKVSKKRTSLSTSGLYERHYV